MSNVEEARRVVCARRRMLALAATVVPLLAGAASAEVAGVGGSGFEVREKAHVGAAPARVYAALITPGRWWDPKHTYSGDASNITLEAKVGGCWCERIPEGGAVEHMTVTYLLPNKAMRFRGSLGPLQAMGLDAVLGAQALRLKRLVETGSAESPTS